MAVEYNGQILKSECLCGIHVHTATKVIIWIQLILQALSVLMIILSMVAFTIWPINFSITKTVGGNSTTTKVEQSNVNVLANGIFNIICASVGILICYMVLHGLKVRRPGYYWPYLIMAIVGIITAVFLVLLLAGITAGFFIGFTLVDTKGNHTTLAIIALVFLLLSIVFLVFYIYFIFVVVNRSRKLLEAEVHNPIPASNSYKPNVYVQQPTSQYSPQYSSQYKA